MIIHRARAELSWRVLTLVIGLIATVLVSPGEAGSQEEDPASSAKGDLADIDELRALPYLGFAEPGEDGRAGVVRFDERRASPGYSLFASHDLCRADLISLEGRIVHSWKDPEPCLHWSNSELLPDGDLIVSGVAVPGERRSEARFLLRLSWSGEVVWRRRMAAHHDVELTPGGHLAVLTRQNRSLPSFDPVNAVRDNAVALLAADGSIVETRSLFDLALTAPDELPLQRVGRNKEGVIDLFHANSVEWMRREDLAERHPLYGLDNVLVSIRHQDAVVIFDWQEERLVWAWGRGQISGPHDATVLANGNILLFDNGLGRGWSRVIELDPVAKEIVWEYRAGEPREFFTASRGASQRLPNGNTLITNSDSGQAFEVVPDGEIVWEFLNPHRNEEGLHATIVRMKRYEEELFESVRRRLRDRSEP